MPARATIIACLTFAAAALAYAQATGDGVTLTLVDGELASRPTQYVPDADLEEFTRETGVRVKRVQGPEGTLNQLPLTRESLRGDAASRADVYTIDVIWPPMLAQYLVDLTPYVSAAEVAAYDPVVRAAYTVDGSVRAMPYRVLLGVLLYRKDLLARYRYAAPPASWDELERMATRIQEGERARGERDFWGYVWQGAASEALTCNALEWQAAEGGGRILGEDSSVSVNNPDAIRAWQRAARWVGSISPPGVVAYREWDTANVWSAGRSAFLRGWASDQLAIDWASSGLGNIRGVHAEDRIGIARLPSGRSGRAGTLGGAGLGVSRASSHVREAVELVRFLSRRRIERLGAPPPTSAPLPDLFHFAALMGAARDPLSARPALELVVRPSLLAREEYEAVSRAYFGAVHSVLTGDRNAPSAAAALEKDLLALRGSGKGSPRRD